MTMVSDGPLTHTNLCLVAAPHQLIGVIEAKQYLKIGAVALVIMTDTYPASGFDTMINASDWEAVYVLEDNEDAAIAALTHNWILKRSYSLRRLAFDRLRRRRIDAFTARINGLSNLILGNYNDQFAHFAKAFPEATAILVDDGTDTLLINNNRHKRRSFRGSNVQERVLALRGRLRNILTGFNAREKANVTFFTSYDIEPRPGDQKITNHHTWLRSLARHSEPSNEIYFLGQPLVRGNWMAEERYLEYVKAIIHHFSGYRLVYVPHKLETDDMIARLQAATDLPVLRTTAPIEYELVRSPRRPRAVSSFMSSALENCHIVFGDAIEVYSFYLRPEDLLNRHESIQQIYDYYSDKVQAIRIIDVLESDGIRGAVS